MLRAQKPPLTPQAPPDVEKQLYTNTQFDDLLTRIGARIARMDTNYRRSIPAEERLSICLRFLATGDSFRTIASSFRVGISTISSIIPDVVAAIWDGLVEEFMPVPGEEEWSPERSCSAGR
uniref:Transposase n=1 Tax=Knipowitschia caucasica TaxID=637954 RepID=A0AAV2K9B4_KNICA